VVEELAVPPAEPITAAHFDEAKERLILARLAVDVAVPLIEPAGVGVVAVEVYVARAAQRLSNRGEEVRVAIRDELAGENLRAEIVQGAQCELTREPAFTDARLAAEAAYAALRRGEAIGLIGSNGSGKSTILRAIAGLLPVNRGAIYTMGQPSLLGANASLLNDLSGEQNVILGLLAMGMTRQQAIELMPGIIEFSGINERDNFGELPMSTYSSGMAARLRFSIAAAKMHDVLLVDEALATGDARFRRRSEKRVRELLGGAGTVFLVSHAVATIVEVCDRSIWLEGGVIRMDGPTAEVVAAYEEYMAR
jgi:teichoic acid transport system ATP-binding protein